MRTLDNIIFSFKEALASIASPLANFANYSNIYALARAFAYPITLKEADIEDLKKSIFISSANGDDLDDRGAELGITRRLGTKAIGSAYITYTGAVFIPAGTLLSNADASLQFSTITSVSANVKIVNIEAVGVGSKYNLPAGTRLYSSLFPNVVFNIGVSLNNGEIFTGDLYGGVDVESDFAYRRRILEYIKGRHYGTYNSILNNLRIVVPFNRIQVADNTPASGVFTVYVDSRDINLIRNIENEIERVKPIGVAYVIANLDYLYIDFSINVKANTSVDLDALSAAIRSTINNSLGQVDIGGVVSLVDILGLLKSISGVESINIVSPNPTRNIQLPENVVPASNNISITITQ